MEETNPPIDPDASNVRPMLGALSALRSAEARFGSTSTQASLDAANAVARIDDALRQIQVACADELQAEAAARGRLIAGVAIVVLGLAATIFAIMQRDGIGSFAADRDAWPAVVRGTTAPSASSAIEISQGSDLEGIVRSAIAQSGDSATNAPLQVVLGPGLHQLSRPLELSASIVLRGQGSGATTIRSSSPGAVVVMRQGSLRLEGLTVSYQGTAPSDVLVVECCELELLDVVVEGGVQGGGSLGIGVNVRGSTRAAVEESTIRGNGFGVAVADRAVASIRDSDIVSNLGRGISFHDDASGEVRSSTIAQNGFGPDGFEFWQGIALQGRSDPEIVGNEIRGNAGIGVQFWNASGGVVRENTITDNGVNIAAHAPSNASAGGIAIGVSGQAENHQPSPALVADNRFEGNFGGQVRDYR